MTRTAERGGIDSARAWRVTVASAAVAGVAFGTIYTFGTFFDAMAAEFDAGLGPTSIVFGLTVFLFFGTGAASGFLADRWGPRGLVIVGGTMFALGLLATSRVTALWQGYLTYGLGAGVGGGLFLSPLFSTSAAWFERYRGIAQGVVATGSGLGTLILVPLAESIIDDQGWRRAFVVLAIIAGGTFFVGALLIERPPVPPPAAATTHLRAVMRTSSFRRLAVSGALQSASMISAFAFIVPFATDGGVESSTAALLVGLIGACSIVGRLVLTGFADRWGPVRTFQLSFLIQPVAFGLWLVSDSRLPLLVLFVIVLGVAYGGFVALIGVVAAHLFGVRGLGSVLGWLYLAGGTGSLVGPPLVGFIADAASSSTLPLNTLPIGAMTILSATGAVLLLRLSPDPVPLDEPAPVEA